MGNKMPGDQLNLNSIDREVKPYEQLAVKENEIYNGWGNVLYKGKPENMYTSEVVVEDWFTAPIRAAIKSETGEIHIADFGGAAGATLDIVQKQLNFPNVVPYNIDINIDAVARGKRKGRHDIVANLAALPIEDAFFDAGYSRSVIQYNPLISEAVKTQEDLLKELHRVLKPHGVLVLTWPGAKNKDMLPALNQASAAIEAYIMGTSVESILKQKCYTDLESLGEVARRVGFEVVEARELLQLPTTASAYLDRFGEAIKSHGGAPEEFLKIYNSAIHTFEVKLNTAVINGEKTLLWDEHRLILRKP